MRVCRPFTLACDNNNTATNTEARDSPAAYVHEYRQHDDATAEPCNINQRITETCLNL